MKSNIDCDILFKKIDTRVFDLQLWLIDHEDI